MPDVIYVKLDIVYLISHQLNETILTKILFFERVKSKVIISLFETVRLSVSISPRNLYNSLKSIKENENNHNNRKTNESINQDNIKKYVKTLTSFYTCFILGQALTA